MRRFFSIAALLLVAALTPSVAYAIEVRTGVGNGGTSADITARTGNGGGSGYPSGGRQSSGNACSSRVIDWTGDGSMVLVPCNYHDGMSGPFAPVEPGPAGPTPQQLAATAQEIARSLPMPTPRPSISAPVGITGAVHSINLRTSNRAYFPAQSTEFGPLTAVANGEFVVDWGDGTRERFSLTGGDWPNKEIAHTWIKTGTYAISVEGQWSVDWQLGGMSGVVGGLRTTGEIPAFQVIEAQAVLSR